MNTDSKMNFDFVKSASAAGLNHQWNLVSHYVLHKTNYPGMTVSETIAFRDALKVELDYRWENGDKQAFEEMIARTFGR